MDTNGLVVGLLALVFVVLLITACLAASRTNTCVE